MKRLLLGAAIAVGACGPGPVVVKTTGTTSTTTSEPTPSTTEAPATTAPPTTSAPAVTAPPSPPSTAGAEPTPPTTVRRTTTTEATSEAASGACGGALPPCWVMRQESGGDPTAVNATGCGGRGCYGKWQADPRTSRSLGYELPMDQYPESVQDQFAAALWAGGAGCAHWAAC